MKRYVNSKGGLIRSIDVVDRPETLDVYLHLRHPSILKSVQETATALGFKTLAQTTVDNQPLLVLNGPRAEAELIQALSEKAGKLTLKAEKKPLDAWKVRSVLGFGGQLLQLSSSVLKNKVDGPLLLFSGTNLAANTINLIYRGQKRDDPHQMRVIKQDINNLLDDQLPPNKALLSIEDDRSWLREHVRNNPVHPVNQFMQRYSVNVGELGLRYVGAFGMAYPASGWSKAFAERRMPMTNKVAPLRTVTGFGSILGKTIATTSKVPDPFNPQPRSRLDELREKYSFLTGGLIEAGAFSVLTYDAWMNTKPTMKNGVLDTSRSLKIGKGYHRDWLSALGGALFVGGYIVRSWAKYGERKVDMGEVVAHASDTICMLPPEKIPQALADTAAQLSNHFNNKRGFSFGELYNKISDDLCREHHISILPPTRGAVMPKEETQLASKASVPAAKVNGVEHEKRVVDAPARAVTHH